jgi:hypothetical protein
MNVYKLLLFIVSNDDGKMISIGEQINKHLEADVM